MTEITCEATLCLYNFKRLCTQKSITIQHGMYGTEWVNVECNAYIKTKL